MRPVTVCHGHVFTLYNKYPGYCTSASVCTVVGFPAHVESLRRTAGPIRLRAASENAINACAVLRFVALCIQTVKRVRWLKADFEITHNDTTQSVGLLWTSDQPVPETSTWQHTQQSQRRTIRAPGRIRTRNPSKRAAGDPRLRPLGHWDRLFMTLVTCKSKLTFLHACFCRLDKLKSWWNYIFY
jgi:hypothetical protein